MSASRYCVECARCGEAVESVELETVCPSCGTMLVFEWRREAVVIHNAKSPYEEPDEPAKALRATA